MSGESFFKGGEESQAIQKEVGEQGGQIGPLFFNPLHQAASSYQIVTYE